VLDQELQELPRTITIDPANADAWAEGAWIFNEMGKFDIAVKAGNKALGIDPNHSNAFREIGYARMKQKKYLDATKALISAIEKNRRNWVAYDYLVQTLESQDEYKLASDVKNLKKTEQGKVIE
jgi:tetratricopeptide (TPR) repeat protein